MAHKNPPSPLCTGGLGGLGGFSRREVCQYKDGEARRPDVDLGIYACSKVEDCTETPEVVPARTSAQAEPTSEGHGLFVAKGCTACHGQNAEGSQIAPALAGHSEAMVNRQVRNPRFLGSW